MLYFLEMNINLNYNWKFKKYSDEKIAELKEDNNYQVIDIPHTVNSSNLTYNNELNYQNKYLYIKKFNLENFSPNYNYILNLLGFMLQADIYINNDLLGHYISGYLPVRINIKNHLKEGENTIIIILDGHEDKDIPPFGNVVDYLSFCGIYREVFLEIKKEVYLENVFIDAAINGLTKVRSVIFNDKKLPYKIIYQIKDQSGKIIKESEDDEFRITSPKLWELDCPYLYTLNIKLISDNQVIDEKEYKYGYREILFKKDGFYLNGNKIKLIGLNRHEMYPYINNALTKSLEEIDAKILKDDLGLNVVRCSHYPQSRHFLNKLDEVGLLYINEVPGWQHIGKTKKWRETYYDFLKKMVLEEYNHPSLIAYGVRIDESMDDHELYLNGNKIVHNLDNYRPTLGVRNFKNSELLEDIYAYNDFFCKNLKAGLENPKHIKSKGKPYLVTEYLGHMFPTKIYDASSRNLEHALRHLLVINDNYKFDNLLGAIGWCYADYYTHQDFGSGDSVCHHGVLDINRNKKWASYAYSSQSDKYEVMEVLNQMHPGDYNEARLEEIYIFTNVDYVKLYKNGQFVKTFYPTKKQFKNLKHPPIIIDDLIGETFLEEKYHLKDRRKIAKLLSYVAIHGFNHLRAKHYLSLAILMIKYHLKYSDLVDLYNKYVASWGGKSFIYRYEGYKNDKLVIEKAFGPHKYSTLNIKPLKPTLNEGETYDIMPIKVSHLDNYNNVLKYSSEVINISVSDNLLLLSPSSVGLLGGETLILVRNKNKQKGEGTIKIFNDKFNYQLKITIQ